MKHFSQGPTPEPVEVAEADEWMVDSRTIRWMWYAMIAVFVTASTLAIVHVANEPSSAARAVLMY